MISKYDIKNTVVNNTNKVGKIEAISYYGKEISYLVSYPDDKVWENEEDITIITEQLLTENKLNNIFI